MSGDKLLGGPQAGLVVGRSGVLDVMRCNPLYRALRVDKMTLAALDAVLLDHASGRAIERIPVHRMLAMAATQIEVRAEVLRGHLQARHQGLVVDLIPGESMVGGGAAPTIGLPTTLLALASPMGAERLALALRRGRPPVVLRIAENRVLVDLRTIAPEDDATLGETLLSALDCGE
jgi:L-seryl-tRNA(Ser) seleniumtransferase